MEIAPVNLLHSSQKRKKDEKAIIELEEQTDAGGLTAKTVPAFAQPKEAQTEAILWTTLLVDVGDRFKDGRTDVEALEYQGCPAKLTLEKASPPVRMDSVQDWTAAEVLGKDVHNMGLPPKNPKSKLRMRRLPSILRNSRGNAKRWRDSENPGLRMCPMMTR